MADDNQNPWAVQCISSFNFLSRKKPAIKGVNYFPLETGNTVLPMFLLPKPLKNVHRIFEGQKLYLQDLLKCSAYVNNNTLHGYYICKCVMHCMIACPSPLRFSICVEAYGMKKVQLEV